MLASLRSFYFSIVEDPAKRKKATIIIGASIVASIVMLAVIFSLGSTGGRTFCHLTNKPRIDVPGDILAIKSEDNKALVHFGGHLRIRNIDAGTDKFLNLDLKQVRYNIYVSDSKHIRLTLEAECATLDFRVRKDDDFYVYRLIQIIVRPKTSDAQFAQCTIPVSEFEFQYTNYWSCLVGKSYECSDIPPSDSSQASNNTISPSEPLARVELRFDFLEFELEGDPSEIADRYFSKIRNKCPWSGL